MIIPDYALWVAIFFFYLVEHLKLSDRRSVLISVSERNGMDISIPRVPYTLLGKQLVILPIFNFSRNVFWGKFKPEIMGIQVNNNETKKIELLSKSLVWLSFAESMVSIFYFICFPIVSHKLGLGLSLLYIIPVHVLIYVSFLILLFRLPDFYKKGKFWRIMLAGEMLISPGLMLALSKRLSTKLDWVKSDVPNLICPLLSEKRKKEIYEIIKFRLEDMVDGGELSVTQSNQYLDCLRKRQ